MQEGGGWVGKGMFEAGYVAEVFRSASALCYQNIGEVLPSEHHKFMMATRFPLGVVSVISPWNMPGILTSRGFAAALAVGDEMIENPTVKAVSFTGSTAVGRHIAAKCGAHLKKACVERARSTTRAARVSLPTKRTMPASPDCAPATHRCAAPA